MRRNVSAGLAIAVALGGGLTYHYTTSGGGAGTTANVFVASTGSDSGVDCHRFSPATTFPSDPTKVCLTLDKADSLLQNGDTGLIKGGAYAMQTITPHSRSASATLSVVSGDTMTLDGMEIQTAYLNLVGPFDMTGHTVDIHNNSDNADHVFNAHDLSITDFVSGVWSIRGAYVTLTDGEIGPWHACTMGSDDGDGIQLSALFYSSAIQEATNHMTFDNVTIHDVDRWANGVDSSGGTCSVHTDGFQTFGGEFITLKNSHLYRNATSQLLWKHEGSSANKLDHILVQNTMFGATLEGGNEILIGDSPTAQNCNGAGTTDVVFQNNTVSQGPVSFACTGTATVVRSNVLPGETCTGGLRNASYTYNVFPTGSDSSCTSTSNAQTCNVSYADSSRATNGNYARNSSDTCATNHGDPVNFVTPDIFGVTRPVGAAPDAAADEY